MCNNVCSRFSRTKPTSFSLSEWVSERRHSSVHVIQCFVVRHDESYSVANSYFSVLVAYFICRWCCWCRCCFHCLIVTAFALTTMITKSHIRIRPQSRTQCVIAVGDAEKVSDCVREWQRESDTHTEREGTKFSEHYTIHTQTHTHTLQTAAIVMLQHWTHWYEMRNYDWIKEHELEAHNGSSLWVLSLRRLLLLLLLLDCLSAYSIANTSIKLN